QILRDLIRLERFVLIQLDELAVGCLGYAASPAAAPACGARHRIRVPQQRTLVIEDQRNRADRISLAAPTRTQTPADRRKRFRASRGQRKHLGGERLRIDGSKRGTNRLHIETRRSRRVHASLLKIGSGVTRQYSSERAS